MLLVYPFYREICNHFSPNGWGTNGPDAISRAFKKICNVDTVHEMKPEICWGFNILSEEVLYPINWEQWKWLFDPSLLNESLQLTKDAVVPHFYNHLSSQTVILKDFENKTLVEMYKEKLLQSKNIKNPFGETAYGAIAKLNCPLAYNSSGVLF